MTYDADKFRRNDRWGRRVYFDPLPACDIAGATDADWLSPTTKRKVFAKEFTKKLDTGVVVPLDAHRVANYYVANRDTVAALDDAASLELLATAAKRDLNRAGARGTYIHTVIEHLTQGQEPMVELIPDAAPFVPAARRFVEQIAPKVLHAERVVIHRGGEGCPHGYGGQFDAIAEIDGTTYLVDYKTRTSNHGAYGEEAAQIAAYARAQYMIDGDGDRYWRTEIPTIDAGLIVSICSDGTFELYPIDLDAGWDYWRAMSDAFELKRTGQAAGRRAVGKPLHVEPADADAVEAVLPGTHDATTAWLLERVERIKAAGHVDTLVGMWPVGVATPKAVAGGAASWSDTDLAAVAVAVAQTQAEHRMPFDELNEHPDAPVVTVPTPPEPLDPELAELVDDDRKAAFRRRLKKLDEHLAADVLAAARRVGVSTLTVNVTVRQMIDIEAALARAEAAQISASTGAA